MWRFVESDEDGTEWLESPGELTAWVEFDGVDDTGASRRLRLMVATRAWLERQLVGVSDSASGPRFVWVPSMVVVPDATGAELRRFVDQAVRDRMSSMFGSAVL